VNRNLICVLMALASVFVATTASAGNNCTWALSRGVKVLVADCTTDTSILLASGKWDLGGHTIMAIDPVGDHFRGGILTATGSNVSITNGRIQADGLADICDTGNDRLRGVFFPGYGGSVSYMDVLGINQGPSSCQEGNGVEFSNIGGTEVSATLNRVHVDGYQKNGITFNGNISVSVRGCSTVGGDYGYLNYIAQNGMQFGYGAHGLARSNSINGRWYDGDLIWSATGILVFESDGVTISGNDVINNKVGVALEAWGFLAPSADENVVSGNRVTNSMWGITAQAYTLGLGYSNMDSSCSYNKIRSNTISNKSFEGDTGIFLGASYDWGGEETGFTPIMTGNQVTDNNISGFSVGIVDDGAGNHIKSNPFK